MDSLTPDVTQSPCYGSDEDDVNYNEIPKVKKVSGSIKYDDLTKSQRSFENKLQKTNLEYIDEEDTDEFRVHSSTTRSNKRKWASNTVISDDEDSYGDNAPICPPRTQHSLEVKENVCRRLRKSESYNKQEENSFDSIESVVSSEDEEDIDGVHESQKEDESMDEFIDDSPESVTDCEYESLDEFIDDSPESVSDCEFKSSDCNYESDDYYAILNKIGRKKNRNMEWNLEGDMLSDFAKDPALCMSAVCALYRQQTADEQASKETIYRNKRGFSQADAWRGSELAKFLMDGDSNGNVKKTVEELKEYDSKGIKHCRKFADKYSKQLFTIYKNREDPYFRPLR